VSLAYLSRDGEICSATVEDDSEGGPRGGVGGCVAPGQLSARVERDGLVPSGLTGGPGGVLHDGFAHRDVVSVRAFGPDGPVEAQLTRPWSPDAPGAEPLRYFAVVVPFGATWASTASSPASSRR
jgi:hypothetical protein